MSSDEMRISDWSSDGGSSDLEAGRGPQSTQQGRNAIGGAVVVKTKDPTFYPEFAVRGIVGNFDRRQVSGMASGPLIDGQLAARIAFDQSTHRSFVDMNDYQGVNNPREFKSTSIRGQLLLTPKGLEDFTATPHVSHTQPEAPPPQRPPRPLPTHA